MTYAHQRHRPVSTPLESMSIRQLVIGLTLLQDETNRETATPGHGADTTHSAQRAARRQREQALVAELQKRPTESRLDRSTGPMVATAPTCAANQEYSVGTLSVMSGARSARLVTAERTVSPPG